MKQFVKSVHWGKILSFIFCAISLFRAWFACVFLLFAFFLYLFFSLFCSVYRVERLLECYICHQPFPFSLTTELPCRVYRLLSGFFLSFFFESASNHHIQLKILSNKWCTKFHSKRRTASGEREVICRQQLCGRS